MSIEIYRTIEHENRSLWISGSLCTACGFCKVCRICQRSVFSTLRGGGGQGSGYRVRAIVKAL